MLTKMFSVFDSKAAVFGVPFFMPNKATAIRSFMDVANDPQTTIYRHPEDFSLFYIGEFDDEKATVTPCNHENLGNAASYKKMEVAPKRDVLGEVLRNGKVEEVTR